MKKSLFLLSLFCFAALAIETPPSIPDGSISYDEVSYQGSANYDSELPPEFITPAAAPATTATYTPSAYVPPAAPAPSSNPRTIINLRAYASNYQVRGMGVTDALSKYGTSSLNVSHTFANRNLFNKGFQHRAHGMAGVIWDASCPLGDIMQYELGYAVGKEVFPNLLIELGYNFRRGGLEGFMAQQHDRASHRAEQDIALTITYNDNQKGFFGHGEWGWGFYGLTGCYFDAEIGYRFTDAIRSPRLPADVEVSVGVAPSISYWGSGVEGVDACRVKLALLPYSPRGTFGRDAHLQIKPWVQCSWTGNNARKIYRHAGYGPVDHFQITFGLDATVRF